MSTRVKLQRDAACSPTSISILVGLSLLSCAYMAQAQNTTSTRHRIVATDCWQMRSLGTLGGPTSSAVDMNDAGQVVGNSLTEPRVMDSLDPADHLRRAFLSAPNGGALTELYANGFFEESARAINRAGQVAGLTTAGRSAQVSFVTDPGGINPRNSFAWADVADINNVGKSIFFFRGVFEMSVVANNDQSDIYNPVYVEIKITDREFPESTEPVELNDAGQALLNYGGFAYRWTEGAGASSVTPNASYSNATSMNEFGQVVGTLHRDALDAQAFVTRRFSDSILMLGQPGDGNQPTDINDFGVIIGTENTGGQTHGYVTTLLGVHTRINLSTLDEVTRDGWSDIRPTAINNRGQIAGTGKLNGNDIAFFLAPRSLLAYVPDRDGVHARCYR